MPNHGSALDQLCINTIRCLSIDAVEKAKSGHPGLPMGAAPMAYVLWQKHLRHHPLNPTWLNRDRFILSPGHGCTLLYSLLHLSGYPHVTLDELKNFRQWGSQTPGHSEYGHTAGVETTTGPLGQGFSNGVGMGIAQKYLAAYFNRPGHDVLDYKIYALVSDGDLMEGVASEAASLAGHLKLDNLIYLYDDNHMSIEGHTTVAFTEDRAKRFEAYGWHVQCVPDGNDLEAIDQAITCAKGVVGKPHIINIRTLIGFGSPNKKDTPEVHGSALGEDEVKLTKKAYGWDPEKHFYVPAAAQVEFRKAVAKGVQVEQAWNDSRSAYQKAHPDLARELTDWFSKKLPAGWTDLLPDLSKEKPMATRVASGKTLNALCAKLPMLLGGSADLAPSTNTIMKEAAHFQAPDLSSELGNYAGRNLHFGVREHAMAAAVNGMALSGALIPYGATFLQFFDYCKAAVRLSAFMGVRSIWVFTHDSIGLGEDGPTHQPIEHLANLRTIHGLVTIRPSDATEVPVAWKIALERVNGPTALVLTRQNVAVLDRSKFPSAANVEKGFYILLGSAQEKPAVILIASGSEVEPTLAAAELLQKEGVQVRVVAAPSLELFDQQSQSYRDEVLPPTVRARVAVEAAHPMCWFKYVGLDGAVVGMNTYGASAPAKVLFEKFGFTPQHIAAAARKTMGK